MTNLSIAFLIIITLAGAIYSLWQKQGKIALGLLILTVAFVLVIPNLASGFMVDILFAISLILYAVGIFVIVRKNDEVKMLTELEEQKDDTK